MARATAYGNMSTIMVFTITTKILSRFPDSPEGWKRFCEIGGLFALAATLFFAGGAWLNSNKISERDAEQKLELQERAAKAEIGLLQLRKQVAPRTVDRKEFLAALEGQQKARVEIMYLRDDPNCWHVALSIFSLLKEAKWDAALPVPIPPGREDSPSAVSVGGQSFGVSVVDHFSPPDLTEEPGVHLKPSAAALVKALNKSIGGFVVFGTGRPTNNPPEGTVRIVVSPHM
jgi:hypothetical protein